MSPLGVGNPSVLTALMEGRGGVNTIADFAKVGLPTQFGAMVTSDFDPKKLVRPRKSLKIMCREIQMGVASATLALEHAEVEAADLESDRFGVVYASELFFGEIDEVTPVFKQCCDKGEFDFAQWGEQAMKASVSSLDAKIPPQHGCLPRGYFERCPRP